MDPFVWMSGDVENLAVSSNLNLGHKKLELT